MSETSNPSPVQPQPSQELHWGISYLREDIQDLRQDLHQAIQGVRQELREDIQDLRQEIRGIHGRIDEVNRSLGARIEEGDRSLSARIDEKYELHNRALRSQLTWLMTTMIALAGIIVAVIKL